MARFRARSLLVVVSAFVLASGCTAPASAQNRSATGRAPASPAGVAPIPAEKATPPPAAAITRPLTAAPVTRLWPFKRIYNADYVDARAIAERYGLKSTWVVSGRIMQLADAQGRVLLRFEDRRRDFFLDGVRVFMGAATVSRDGSLWVGKIDVIKTIAPLLRPADHADQLPGPPKLIVLDAGHGGIDPGTQNLALHLDEKDMTLDVVLRLKKVLEARGYKILLTRTNDSRVELETRPGLANEAKADLFLSVHFNKAEAASVAGSETYALTPQFQVSAEGSKDKLTDLALPGNKRDFVNVVLCYNLQKRLLAALKTSDRGFKRARWVVLRFAECPAALIEAAFLSNAAEARKVAMPEYRQKIAQAIADGVDDYAATLAAFHPAVSLPSEPHIPAPTSK